MCIIHNRYVLYLYIHNVYNMYILYVYIYYTNSIYVHRYYCDIMYMFIYIYLKRHFSDYISSFCFFKIEMITMVVSQVYYPTLSNAAF